MSLKIGSGLQAAAAAARKAAEASAKRAADAAAEAAARAKKAVRKVTAPVGGPANAAKLAVAAGGAGAGIKKAVDEFKAGRSGAPQPAGKGVLAKLGRGASAGGAVLGAARLPGQVGTAVKDIRQAVRTRSAGDVHQALDSSRSTAVSVRGIGLGAREVPAVARGGVNAFKRVAPEVSEKIGSAASRAAGTGLVRAGQRIAAREGVEAAGKGLARVGAKALGRFAPGANIAIAVLDTASFVNTLRDPNASTGKKVLSGITAAGSIVAATNIPVVSQVGAAVLTVTSVLQDVKLPKISLPKISLPKVSLPNPFGW